MNRRFTLFITVAMIAGIAAGYLCREFLPAGQAQIAANWFGLTADIFLRLIKMIIAPLVFATLVVGIANMGDASSVGRIGLKTITWFLVASIVSLLLGLLMVHLIQPGAGVALPIVSAAPTAVDPSRLTVEGFIIHIFPRSIIEAMADNEILQIVIFSLFVGVAIAGLGEKAAGVRVLVEEIVEIMLKVTGYVMRLAPLAVFAALAQTVTENGIAILGAYAKYVLGFYLSLSLLWLILIAAGVVFIGVRVLGLVKMIRPAMLLAFSTASSEAAYPKTLEQIQKWGVPRRIASFVLPLGYSFNLDGSMMYCSFAVLFICQAYGIEVSIGEQFAMLAMMMVTSKGMAAVPRGSLVVVAATIAYFRLPEAGLALVLAVDHLLDMGRTATNVLGNSVASAVVARWEGELGETAETDENARPLPAHPAEQIAI
jgi:Na+/H+-dicarboxylate symporter